MPEDINNNETSEKTTSTTVVKDEWMIRGCEIYDDEYSDCCSLRARFNQYFIFGKTIDCNQWKRDSINCYKWVENKDINAANELVQSEKNRMNTRLTANNNNDVWKKRNKPPEDWNKPLPEHLLKDYENSYLNIKAKEMKGEIPPTIDSTLCSIM